MQVFQLSLPIFIKFSKNLTLLQINCLILDLILDYGQILKYIYVGLLFIIIHMLPRLVFNQGRYDLINILDKIYNFYDVILLNIIYPQIWFWNKF